MARVTSKRQVTIPKRIADRYGIRSGDEIEWIAAGDVIRVIPGRADTPAVDIDRRTELFDAATERQHARQAGRRDAPAPGDRGWRREDLYARGRAD